MGHSFPVRDDGTFKIVQFTDLHWQNGEKEDFRTRDLMEKILLREVGEIGGEADWVPVVLGFCYDELCPMTRFKNDFDDPRFARALLAGGDRLMDGTYLEDFRKVCGIKSRL